MLFFGAWRGRLRCADRNLELAPFIAPWKKGGILDTPQLLSSPAALRAPASCQPPTHLKNMLIKLEIFPKVRGENKKYLKPPTRLVVLLFLFHLAGSLAWAEMFGQDTPPKNPSKLPPRPWSEAPGVVWRLVYLLGGSSHLVMSHLGHLEEK